MAPQQSRPNSVMAPQQSRPNSVMAPQQSWPNSVMAPQQSWPNSVMALQQSRPNSGLAQVRWANQQQPGSVSAALTQPEYVAHQPIGFNTAADLVQMGGPQRPRSSSQSASAYQQMMEREQHMQQPGRQGPPSTS
eukprot:177314-Chlamydomonas_euryale.AAC.1